MYCKNCGFEYPEGDCPNCGFSEKRGKDKKFLNGFLIGLGSALGCLAVFVTICIVGLNLRKQQLSPVNASVVSDTESSIVETIPKKTETDITEESFTAVATEPQKTTPPPTQKQKVHLYSDKKVTIYFDRCATTTSVMGDYEIVFLVENKTDFTLTIQAESMSLDGTSISSRNMIMSDEVAPKSKGRVYLIVDEVISLKPQTISGELSVIDFNADIGNQSYDAKFVNIKL